MKKEEKTDKDQQERQPKKSLSPSDFGRYLGLGTQIMATVLFGVLAGLGLDHLAGTEKPIFTIIVSSVAIIAAIYQLIKPFI